MVFLSFRDRSKLVLDRLVRRLVRRDRRALVARDDDLGTIVGSRVVESVEVKMTEGYRAA